jgi:hypothetical protein
LTTVAGQNAYTLTNDYVDVKAVAVSGENTETSTDDNHIVQPPPDEVRWEKAGYESDVAWPVYYLIIEDDLYVRPAPLESGKTINIVGIVEPTVIGAADSTIFRNNTADDILEFMIASEIQEHDGYNQDAQIKMQKALTRLERTFDKEQIPAELYAKAGN